MAAQAALAAAAARESTVSFRGTTTAQPVGKVVYEWTVERLSVEHLKQAAKGDVMRSPPFEAFGASFCLEIQPGHLVDNEPETPQLGIFIALTTPGTTMRVSYTLDYGPNDFKATRSFSTVVPKPADSDRVSGLSFPHSAVFKNPGAFFKDGSFTVKATLIKVGGVSGTPGQVVVANGSPPCPVVVPPSSFPSEMRQLLAGTRGLPTDVTLTCSSDGERVPAHSLILCLRSSVFRALLAPDSGLAAVDRSAVPVCAEVTGPTLRRVLEFVYTDELTPSSPEEAQHLLHAADYYELGRLKAICERALCEQLSVDNVAFALTLAAQHRARALEREALLFAARHAAEVLGTEGWRHLSETRPELKDKVILAVATGKVPEDEAAQQQGAAAGGEQQQAAGGAGAGGSNKRARRSGKWAAARRSSGCRAYCLD